MVFNELFHLDFGSAFLTNNLFSRFLLFLFWFFISFYVNIRKGGRAEDGKTAECGKIYETRKIM
jgi:hypothetical protein